MSQLQGREGGEWICVPGLPRVKPDPRPVLSSGTRTGHLTFPLPDALAFRKGKEETTAAFAHRQVGDRQGRRGAADFLWQSSLCAPQKQKRKIHKERQMEMEAEGVEAGD